MLSWQWLNLAWKMYKPRQGVILSVPKVRLQSGLHFIMWGGDLTISLFLYMGSAAKSVTFDLLF